MINGLKGRVVLSIRRIVDLLETLSPWHATIYIPELSFSPDGAHYLVSTNMMRCNIRKSTVPTAELSTQMS